VCPPSPPVKPFPREADLLAYTSYVSAVTGFVLNVSSRRFSKFSLDCELPVPSPFLRYQVVERTRFAFVVSLKYVDDRFSGCSAVLCSGKCRFSHSRSRFFLPFLSSSHRIPGAAFISSCPTIALFCSCGIDVEVMSGHFPPTFSSAILSAADCPPH